MQLEFLRPLLSSLTLDRPPPDVLDQVVAPHSHPDAVVSPPYATISGTDDGERERDGPPDIATNYCLFAANGADLPVYRGEGVLPLIIDSGCTPHIHNVLSHLVNVRSAASALLGINGAPVGCSHIGDLPVLARDSNNNVHTLTLRNVHYVPASHYSVLSVRELNKGNVTVEFDDRMRITLASNVVFEFGLEEGIFVWQVARLSVLRRPHPDGGASGPRSAVIDGF